MNHASREQPLPLVGLTRDRLPAAMADADIPERQRRMRASQLWRWIYNRGAVSFAAMTDIGKELRTRFAEIYTLDRPEVVTEQISADGTRKWLLRLAADERGQRHEIETVYIPEEDRARSASRARSAAP